MPRIRMPDGTLVDFPESMPREQIAAMIRKKFPDAPGHLDPMTQVGKGGAQGITSSLLDVTSVLPGDELPFLPEPARRARQAARGEAQKFADQPSEGTAQDIGKFAGGMVPYAVGGPMDLAGGLPYLAARAGFGKAAPWLIRSTAHLLGAKLGLPHLVAEWLLRHPKMQQAMPLIQGLIGETAGGLAGGTGGAAALGTGAVRAVTREDDNAQTPTPPAPSSPAPITPEVPGRAPARGAPQPQPGPDVATDNPVANRSSRGDRLPLYRAPTN